MTNVTKWRERHWQVRFECKRKGHVWTEGSDCCQRCRLPIELVEPKRERANRPVVDSLSVNKKLQEEL